MDFDQQPIGPGRDRRLRHWRPPSHLPVCVAGIDSDPVDAKVFQRRDGRKVQRVPILRFEGADAAFRITSRLRLPQDMMLPRTTEIP